MKNLLTSLIISYFEIFCKDFFVKSIKHQLQYPRNLDHMRIFVENTSDFFVINRFNFGHSLRKYNILLIRFELHVYLNKSCKSLLFLYVFRVLNSFIVDIRI